MNLKNTSHIQQLKNHYHIKIREITKLNDTFTLFYKII